MITIIVAVCVYLAIAVGSMRILMPRQYDKLRVPHNGVQMSVDDAKREAIKLSAQNGFLWPLFLATGALLAPMVVVFDGVPWAAKHTGRGLMAAGAAVHPAIAPLTNWAGKPLALAVKREEALALTARAEEPVDDAPLVPDEIATWTPPVRPTIRSHIGEDDVVIEHIRSRKSTRDAWREFG